VVLRSLVIDDANEGQQIRIQPENGPARDITTGATVVPNFPMGGTYWIDNTKPAGGDGTDELPFNTIAAGIAAIALQAIPVGTLLMAGRPDYTSEGLLAVPDAITLCIFGWRSPSQQPFSFALTAGTGSPLIYLRGCNVELTLGQAIVQSDMTSIVAVSNVGGSTLVMRGGSARLGSQICRLSGSWDDAACSLMHVGTVEGALDCVSLSCDACAVEGSSLVAGTVDFRTTSFSTALAITATTIRMDRQSERSAAAAGVLPSTLPIPLEPPNPYYGSGITGDVTQAASTVLARAAEYNSLTMTTGQVRCEPVPLRVRNLLDLRAAAANAITDYVGGGGANGAGAAGGGAWGGTGGYSQGTGGTLSAPSGASGVVGAVGVQATIAGTVNATFGGTGGACGAGGTGAAGVGGAARVSQVVTNERELIHWPIAQVGPSSSTAAGSVTTAPVPVMGGGVGQGGSSGGGDAGGAGFAGGGGGGAGRGGGVLVIYARGIALGAATPAGVISARGQAGGNGAAGTGGATGGGAGGGGGGGGGVLIAYDWIIGTPPAADEIDASGGAGGGGGAAAGAGTAGGGGNGGNGGQITLLNLLTGARSVITGAAGSVAVGTAGGAGGACTADLS
jgi:hypothetical protein